MEAGGQSGQQEEHKPSKKESCLNNGCELACCFSSALACVLALAGSGLVARAARRSRLTGRTGSRRFGSS